MANSLLPPNHKKPQCRQQTSPTNNNTQHMSSISNVYKLPSIKQVIKYHHAAVEYTTKMAWIQVINEGLFALWPMLTLRAVNKYYPESTKTQKGHMKQQRQGLDQGKKKKILPTCTSFTSHNKA